MPPTLDPLPRFRCVEHDADLAFDGKDAFACARCETRLRVRDDLLVEERARGSERDEKVKFAYRLYSLVYPVVALLALWTVWRGSVRRQVRFFRDRIREAGEGPGFLLDVGTGDGSLTRLAARKVDRKPAILGVDLSEAMLKKAVKRLRRWDRKVLYVADIGTAALPERAFPAITCFGTVHVFSDPLATLRRIRDLMTDDGVFSGSYLLAPGTPRRDRFVAWAKRHGLLATSYDEAGLDGLVAEAGFRYTRKERNGKMILFTLGKA
jgi:SAM-dependent methyltransferase